MSTLLRERFLELLARHVSRLKIRGNRATGLCPFHPDRHPSFSADLERGVWYCFPCNRGGGVKAFAEAIGEAWNSTRGETRAAKARRARFQAEQRAREILTRRVEERDKELCAEHREVHAEALGAADLLALFQRHPDLAAEFPDLLAKTEQEYGEALFKLSVLAAKLDGEVE